MISTGWTLSETVRALPDSRLIGDGADKVRLSALVTDSRNAVPGVIFCALPGTKADGRDFAGDAVRRGAVAVLTTRPLDDLPVPQVIVPDARRALAQIALAWYGSPDRDLTLVGVTGTSGKTTTVRLIAAMASAAGHISATIGTLGASLCGGPMPFEAAWNTTPEAHELRRMLIALRDRGATLLAMEVSSHALVLDRVWGMRFAAAAFTNLTEDHLDFHRTREDYFRAKARLFSELDERAVAAISTDDPYGERLLGMTRARVITYGWSGRALVRPVEVSAIGRIRGDVETPLGRVRLDMPLVGRFNAANALTAISVGVGLGMTVEQIGEGLATATPAPGRFEPVVAGQDFTVVVDYAHKPDALENVLQAAREMACGKVICVVGCGGDRDPFKRPVMGEIATRLADFTVFTSDNPRTEDPEAILDAIVAGAGGGHPFERIEPRRDAIRRAIGLAQTGDVVVIAGKGHEPYQEIGHTRYPFDDRVEARRALEALRARAGTLVNG